MIGLIDGWFIVAGLAIITLVVLMMAIIERIFNRDYKET
jgi:hypothetical protein